MSLLSDILTAEQIDELYRCGFSVILRPYDQFEIPAALIKPDWSYQWNIGKPAGWIVVNHQDHPGWFAPPGSMGPVMVGGQYLCKKLKSEVEEFHRKNREKSREQLEGWADRFGMFTGGATMLETNGEEVRRTEITAGEGVDVKVETYERPSTKTVELVSKLPKDMIPYIDEVFAERDRIKNRLLVDDEETGRPFFRSPPPVDYAKIAGDFWAAVDRDKGAPWWPTLNAIILPYAIENVRKANAEKTNGEPADGH